MRDAVDRVLRDFGFVEVMRCAYRSAWGEPGAAKLRAALRKAKCRGVGGIVTARLRGVSYSEL